MDAKNFAAGAMANILTSSCMQPLDVTKTFYLYQHKIPTIKGCVQHIYSTFGVRGFWRGYSASITRSCVGGGFTFFWYEGIKSMMGTSNSNLQQFLTDGFATVVGRTLAITVQCPLSVVKVKMENPAHQISVGLTQIMQGVYKKEGLKGFYCGLVPNLLRDVPYSALAVPFYEQYAKLLMELSGQDRRSSSWINFVAGGLGGMTACVLTQPFDVIKTRAMSGYSFGGAGYCGIYSGIKYIYSNEGLFGFTKGLSIRITERSLGQAFIWLFYMKIKKALNTP